MTETRRRIGWQVTAWIAVAMLGAACGRNGHPALQGYVEGEFVYAAAPTAGRLEQLHVRRGEQVHAGAPLFDLEDVRERTAASEAERRLVQARANLEDLTKGQRPEEMNAIQARMDQALAALAVSEREFERQGQLMARGVATRQEFDRTKGTRDQDRERVEQIRAELETARLGARKDQLSAAEANVQALEAALERARWELTQKRQLAPASAAVFDTLHRVGEQVPAARPVVALLPAENILVRAFVPETDLSQISVGTAVTISIDGIPQSLKGKIRYISPKAEYTPPVIYSREGRSKLVYMIEITPDETGRAGLRVGQPVDVHLP